MSDPLPIAYLAAEPRRFHFDAAVRLLLNAASEADPAAVIRFHAISSLAFPPAEVMAYEPGREGGKARLSVGHIGLAGAMGVLPRFYTEVLDATLRQGSSALADFLDLLGERFIAAFADARAKYRLSLASERARLAGKEDPITLALLALTGYGLGDLAARVETGKEPLEHYSGLFAERRRSAERLRALASDWLGRTVTVVQFAGGWLPIPATERTRLAGAREAASGAWNRLGADAAIGVRAWDPSARVLLRVGPLDRASFRKLLPDQPALRRFVALVRAFLGYTTGFAVNLVLARSDVPPLRLAADADTAPRLGWNTWLPEREGAGRGPAGEAVFAAEVVEAGTGRAG